MSGGYGAQRRRRMRSVGHHKGSHVDQVLRLAISELRVLRERRAAASDELHDRVSDRAITTLMRRPELGCDRSDRPSRSAVRRLVRRTFLWELRTTQAQRFHQDGSRRATPSAAVSLDSPIGADGTETLGDRLSTSLAPERIVLARETLRELRARVGNRGALSERIFDAYLFGYGPSEIAQHCDLSADAVAARKSRLLKSLAPGPESGSTGRPLKGGRQ